MNLQFDFPCSVAHLITSHASGEGKKLVRNFKEGRVNFGKLINGIEHVLLDDEEIKLGFFFLTFNHPPTTPFSINIELLVIDLTR